ncbi:MAG: MFS transporter, partial [Planctomycetota bacterium]
MPSLGNRSFRQLLLVQATTSFCDNAWKMVVILLAARALGEPGSPSFEAEFQLRSSLTAMAFLIPFILGGLLAAMSIDRMARVTVIRMVKFGEMIVMALGSWWIMTHPETMTIQLVVMGSMGLLGSWLSPAKYSLLPEMLPDGDLMRANAQLETVSLGAVIAGLAAGAPLLQLADMAPMLFVLLMGGIAALGFQASWRMTSSRPSPAEPPADTNRGLKAGWRVLCNDKLLRMTALGLAAFWGLSQLLMQDVVVHAKSSLHLGEWQAGALMASCALGIGLGCLACARLSGDVIEVGYVPIGAFGMFLFPFLMTSESAGFTTTAVCLILTGLSGGFVLIPLNAQLQHNSAIQTRGSLISLSNSLSFTAMLLGSGAAYLASSTGYSALDILILCSLLG